MGKSSLESINNSEELNSLRDKNSKLQSELDVCNQKFIAKNSGGEKIPSSLGFTPASVTAVATGNMFDDSAAMAAFGKRITKDDLKVIEGIGPKISEMFQSAGIKTWKALSETPVAGCQDILNGGGERYKVHDPASWPMQAKMCYEGKWKELFRWQQEHNHGKL